jgi:dolichol-phosphate mannosyltransferase
MGINMKSSDVLLVCPFYNESRSIVEFFRRVVRNYRGDLLFINDGSTDDSFERLMDACEGCYARFSVITHESRMGYGAAILAGLQYALRMGYEKVITIDTDLQHEPEDIPRFEQALNRADVVIGSRYKEGFVSPGVPQERLAINRYISALLREILFGGNGRGFTDSFCGFRGYRRRSLEKTHFEERSYGIALEILLEMVRTDTSFVEIPVAPIYLDSGRCFYDGLNNPLRRLEYYERVIRNKLREFMPDHPWVQNDIS